MAEVVADNPDGRIQGVPGRHMDPVNVPGILWVVQSRFVQPAVSRFAELAMRGRWSHYAPAIFSCHGIHMQIQTR